LDEDHNSSMEWMNHPLPGGLQSKKDSSQVEVKVQIEVRSEV